VATVRWRAPVCSPRATTIWWWPAAPKAPSCGSKIRCRPAVDRLFGSAAEVYGAGVLAVVLTGMGVDGLAGCRAVGAAGGEVIVQDAMTSVVWGMPGSVADAGLADAVLPLVQIGPMIIDRVALGRPSFAGALDAWRERVAGSAPSAVIT
jgi:CheB methylesterase